MGCSPRVGLLSTMAGKITAKEVGPHHCPLELPTQGRGQRMQSIANRQRPRECARQRGGPRSQEHLLLFQRTEVWFPAPTYNTLSPDLCVKHTDIHAGKNTHKITRNNGCSGGDRVRACFSV